MNDLWFKLRANWYLKRRSKGLALSLVILFGVIALAGVVTHAWVETVSSIKITNEAGTTGSITTRVVKTDALIGDKTGTIDLADYFKKSGDMHFAPASSADGKTFYFPKANMTSGFNVYRKGTSADVNTTYLSATFRLKADTNADFFFTAQPPISVADDIRVSVTAYTEGDNPEGTYNPSTGQLVSNTKIYANKASTSTTAVVNSTTGTTGATKVEKFTDHQKGKSSTARLFAIGANETKIVTINIWLQKKADDDNTDLTGNMSVSQAINNLGITSSLTPRHVTLIPTPTWDKSDTTEYFYAWCWGATNGDASRLYKLELDDNEHYGFDYNGTYQNTLFFRSGNANLTKEYLEANNGEHWNDNTVWNVTEDTAIPNDPVDPTFIIETINGSTLSGDDKYDPSNKKNISDWDTNPSGRPKKSTGSWHDPVTVKLAHVTDQADTWGTFSATSYIGATTSTHVMEATNSGSEKHKDTIHAWAGKKLQLTATAKSGYRFVGWYDNVEGTGTALSTNATYADNAPTTEGGEITYYAKFVERSTLTIYRYLDGSNESTACGTITIGGTPSTTGTTATGMFDKGTSVAFSAEAASGYTLSGIYTTQTGITKANSPITLNANTTYYARFTTNSYDVTAHSRNSTNGTTYSTSDNTTGGTVQVGSATAGASSTASVKYKSTVTLKATAKSGYAFVGWFSSESATTAVSTQASYSYTLSTVGAKDLYARFRVNSFNVTANAYYTTNGSSYSSGSTGGTVKAGSAAAGATSSATVTVGSSVTLTASPVSGYVFDGWYTASTGGSQLSTGASYSYTLNSYANTNVYARFIKESWSIKYGVSGASSGWNSTAMTVSGNTATGTMTLTEGQDFSFQIVKTVGSTDTWYGGKSSYSNITSTSFISNKTLSVDGGDIYMKGHAGTYTFTFNTSSKVLNVTASYSNITITFDYTDASWWGNDNAVISFYDGSGESNMSNVANQTKKTLSISSTRGNSGNVGFNRWNNSSHSTFWNNENAGTRGYSTTYKIGSGWQ